MIRYFFLFTALLQLAAGCAHPTGNILRVNIFKVEQVNQGSKTIEFNTPKRGKAVLRLVNGARIGAPVNERVASAKISLNEKLVKTVEKRNNIAEATIDLVQGANVLAFDPANAAMGQRLSARIDAPADRITLDPFANAGAVHEPMAAVAKVSALGVPVEGANVRFEVIGAGLDETARTGPSGGVTALLKVGKPGTFKLRATVEGIWRKLVAERPIKVLAKRGLVLEQHPGSLWLPAGSTSQVHFTIDARSETGAQDRITLKSQVSPGGDGLTFDPHFPAEGLDVVPSQSLPFLARVTAKRPGAYTVTTTAQNVATGEAFNVVLPVKVVNPGTPAPLFLGIPLATPAGVKPNTASPVVFRAQVDGGSRQPEILYLDEMDSTGKSVKPAIALMRDDGKSGDSLAGDRIYSGVITIDRPASELRFRVRTAYFGKEVVSGGSTFLVTPFPLKARPSDPAHLVSLSGTPGRVFDNEVEIQTIPDVPPNQVEAIAASIHGSVVGVIAPLRIYLIEFPGDGTIDGVSKAIAKVKTFSQVRLAASNPEVVDAGIIHFETDCESTDLDCPNDGEGRWYLDKIGARQAWARAGGGSPTAMVAVVDGGVDCGHPDLVDICDTAGTDEHATQVGGLIAANANNGRGIAGVAWNTELESSVAAVQDGDTFKNAIASLALADSLKVVNISQQILLVDGAPDVDAKRDLFRQAICRGIQAGKLVVVAGGNIGNDLNAQWIYPAHFNSETTEVCKADPELDLPERAIPDHLLAVGGSNQDDVRATWIEQDPETEEDVNLMSSMADFLDIYAPGVDIDTITRSGDTATVSGTCFATAIVSGAAAVLWPYGAYATPSGEIRAKAVHDRLVDTAVEPINEEGENVLCPGCKRLNLGAAIPRKPARLVLVLDKSGSMAWSSNPIKPGCEVYAPPPEGCEPDRWTILTDAVEQMLAVAEGHEDLASEDRFAVAFFDYNVDDPADKKGFVELDEDFVNFATDSARSPGGVTSIGAGVTAFLDAFTDSSANDYRQTILLFTDGDQNWRPYLVTDDATEPPGVFINPLANAPGGDPFPADVNICPFALRADEPDGALGTTYLQKIVESRCDDSFYMAMNIPPDAAALQTFFQQVLNYAITGDKLELALVKSGQAHREERPVISETFTTSRDDGAFTLLINWPESEDDLRKVVLSKDGVDFPVTGGSSAVHLKKGENYMAITLRQPYCHNGKCVKNGGEWTLHMTPSFKVSNPFKYNLFLTVDNASLASAFRVSQSNTGIGRPLRLTARLTEAGSPIENLRPGSVWAVVSRPKASLGNVLSRAKISPVRPNEGDPISAAGRKASAMLADKKLRASILEAVTPTVEKKLVLTEGKPGSYEAVYNDTSVSGIYSVRFYVDGQSDLNGRFTRTFSSARSVEPMVDQGTTLDTIRVSKITPCHLAGGCYAISVKPTDARGNLLGPGKGSLINIAKSKFSGRILKPTSDELDGRYTIRIGYPKPRQKEPVIHVGRTRIPVALEK